VIWFITRLLFAAASLALATLLLLRARVRPPAPLFARLALWGLAAGAGAAVLAALARAGFFALAGLLADIIFLQTPAVLALLGVLLLRRAERRPRLAAGAFLLAAALLAVFLEARVFGPARLRVRTCELTDPALAGLARPVIIAVVADIQTDRVGPFERRVLARVRDARPDLVLFAGDYIQAHDPGRRRAQAARLRRVLLDLLPPAPLGSFAVPGNIDALDWHPDVFAGTGVRDLSGRTVSVRLPGGPLLALSGLSMPESFIPGPGTRQRLRDAAPPDAFRLVLGHSPDAAPPVAEAGLADLYVAGHTHGGQIVLPGFGPLLTLSRLPRRVAAGGVHRFGDTTLVLSRGLGMERGGAPRFRLFCPPEIVLVRLVPPGP
jgi:predicted MPP superfamily phosphohydrolase